MHLYFTKKDGPLYCGRRNGTIYYQKYFVPERIEGSKTVIHIHVEPDVLITSSFFSGFLDTWSWTAIVIYTDDWRIVSELNRFIDNLNRSFKLNLPECFRKPGDQIPALDIVHIESVPGFPQLKVKDLEWW